MADLDEISKRVSKLSVAEIQGLSDDEIMDLAMERPWHPGQYGFLLSPKFFDSEEHMGNTLYELLQRLDKVDNIQEKMGKRQGR